MKEHDVVLWPHGKAKFATIVSWDDDKSTCVIEWGPNGFERYVEDVKKSDLLPMELVSETYGDLFTVKDFLQQVYNGFLNDYDGSARWSDGNYCYEYVTIEELVQRVKEGFTPKAPYTHIVWLNK